MDSGDKVGTKCRDANSKQDSYSCTYCGKTWTIQNVGAKAFDRMHCYSCPVMRNLEAKRSCKYCKKSLRESKCCLHEFICAANPQRLESTYTKQPVKCPECKKVVGSYSKFRRHLTMCLKGLKKLGDTAVRFAFEKTNEEMSGGKENYYRCKFCHKALSERSFERHSFACKFVPKHLLRNRKCRQCKLDLPLQESLIHESTCGSNGKDGVYKCVNCDQREFEGKFQLMVHLCYCVKYFGNLKREMLGRQSLDTDQGDSKEPLSDAESTMSPRSKITKRCPFCKDTPGDKRINLHNHLTSCNKFKQFQEKQKCSFCPKKDVKTAILAHEALCPRRKKGPDEEKGHYCTICKKTFPTRGTYRYHLGQKCLKGYLDGMLEKHATLDDDDTDQQESVEPSTSIKDPREEVLLLESSEPITDIDETSPASVKMEIDEQNEEDDTAGLGSLVKTETEVPKPEVEANKNPVIIKITSLSQTSQVICPFCPKSFPSIEELKTKHPVACRGIKKFEPKKTCPYCDLTLPNSLWGLHILVCKKNIARLPLSKGNLHRCDIFCPECQIVRTAKWMPEHLATCFKHIQMIMENALVNSTLDWRDSEQTDFIHLAGLSFWLEDKDI